MNILMVAAENDGLPKAKVGGVGDVVRDVPPALARLSCNVKVVVPSYGFLHKLPGSQVLKTVKYKFAGAEDEATIYEVSGKAPHPGVKQFVIDHPRFVSFDKDGRYEIYHPDPKERPFATDASKYARFCMAVAEAIKQNVFEHLDCIHLHDWHAALLLILRQYHKDYLILQSIRTAYTIHNLAIQGVRPFKGDESSLEAWYPELKYEGAKLADPRWQNCENPMEVGIRFADAVHTVSSSYAEEILEPSNEPHYYGGEGLEEYLLQAKNEGRLFGIINGCEYPMDRRVLRLDFTHLMSLLKSRVLQWAGTQRSLSASHFVAYTRLTNLSSRPTPGIVLTSVSRIADQKTYLMKSPGSLTVNGRRRFKSGLEGILEGLGTQGIYLLLGTGREEYERFLLEVSARFDNFVFLNGYSDDCAQALYANGDLFLMPSSLEPCGISQMLAMRDGQPCVVHHVGGLKDTVKNGTNGFAFEGKVAEEQVDLFVETCLDAIKLKMENPEQWQDICENAREARFLWKETVNQYIERLYRT
jgi:starch synthase